MESLNGPQEKTRMGTAGRSPHCPSMLAKFDAMQKIPARQHLPLCGPHEERQVPAVHCVLSADGQRIKDDETVVGVAEEQEQLSDNRIGVTRIPMPRLYQELIWFGIAGPL